MSLWHWLLVHLSEESGTSSSSSRAYNFWSGFGANFGEFALIGGAYAMVRHHTCAHKPCWRIARHPTASGFKLCHKHLAMPASALDLPKIDSSHT